MALNKKIKGFTIVELIMVIILISIVFSMVYMGMGMMQRALNKQINSFDSEIILTEWFSFANQKIALADSTVLDNDHLYIYDNSSVSHFEFYEQGILIHDFSNIDSIAVDSFDISNQTDSAGRWTFLTLKADIKGKKMNYILQNYPNSLR